MAEEKSKHDDAGRKDQTGQEQPVPCIRGCAFFGDSTTMNLCSKCYKDNIFKRAKTISPKAAVVIERVSEVTINLSVAVADSAVNLGQASSTAGQAANRCALCRCRIGLTAIKCRCGKMLCSAHRYPKEHDCSYDYKTTGRDAIARANPLIKAEKVRKNF